MAVFNGRLTAEAGLCLTTAIIHVVAIIFALITTVSLIKWYITLRH